MSVCNAIESADKHIDLQKGIKKPSTKHRRTRPGARSLKEIDFYQKSERMLIPRAAMKRVIREGIEKYSSDKPLRIREKAFNMIQTAVEDFSTILFKAVQDMAIHAKRKTIHVEDMRTLKRVMFIMNGGEDLDDTPINPRMSAAHRKNCERENKSRDKRRRNRDKNKRKTTNEPLFKVAPTEEHAEYIIEEEDGGMDAEIVIEADDEWLLNDQ